MLVAFKLGRFSLKVGVKSTSAVIVEVEMSRVEGRSDEPSLVREGIGLGSVVVPALTERTVRFYLLIVLGGDVGGENVQVVNNCGAGWVAKVVVVRDVLQQDRPNPRLPEVCFTKFAFQGERLTDMKLATLGAIALAFTATSNSFTVPTSTNTKSPSASSAMSRLALQPTNNLLRPSSTALHLSVSGIMTRPVALAVGGTISALVAGKAILDRPSRPYNPDSVATEYDAWTEDGILEYYWGEHIHLGYYSEKEMERGYKKTNFIEAKYKFIDEMMR